MKLQTAAVLALTIPLIPSTFGEIFLIGTAGGKAKGIYAADFDPRNGAISNVRLAAEAEGPGFLDFHPSLPVVYAVGKSSVASFKYTREGALELLNRVDCGDDGTCHLEVHPSGLGLAAANYGGGSFSTFLLGKDGRILVPAKLHKHHGSGPNRQRQTAPHAHGTHFLGDLLLVPDLGIDKVMLYTFDPRTGNQPRAADPDSVATLPGDGPRHAAFHPSGHFAFVNHELSSFIESYRLANGRLKSISRISTLPPDFNGANKTAEVAVHPDGKWVFVSNRGHESIAVLAFDEATGQLNRGSIVPCSVRTPRHFTLSPDGLWLLAAGQDSDSIEVMNFDPATGGLQPTHGSASVPRPICLKFLPPHG